jgi:voltage-gated potassium channel
MGGVLRRIRIPSVIAGVLAFNGFVNLATGLAPVFRLSFYVDEVPQYLRITPAQRTSGMVSVFLGILLIALGKGLYERRRRSWFAALLVLVVLMANNLYRATTPHTAFLSGALLVGLLAFRKRFNVRSEARAAYAQIVALAGVLFALGYGIVGTYLLRAEFAGIQTWTDAAYFTFVTYSTLGYGDMLPRTDNAKIFAVSMVVIGLTSFITAVGVLLGPALERRMKGVLRIVSKLQGFTDHVIICGYSNVAESAIDELQERGTPYVIIEDREALVLSLRGKGHEVLQGNPARREVLAEANLAQARAVIAACDSDSDNLLIAVTAVQCRESANANRFRVIVRVEDEENVRKAERVGADEVISPSTMAGRLMAAKALEAE